MIWSDGLVVKVKVEQIKESYAEVNHKKSQPGIFHNGSGETMKFDPSISVLRV